MKVALKELLLLIACVVAFMTVWVVEIVRSKSHEVKPIASAVIASVQPSSEANENAMLRSHWKAIERCWNEGRVPVMGYNYAVVCLNKQNVAWTQIDKLPF